MRESGENPPALGFPTMGFTEMSWLGQIVDGRLAVDRQGTNGTSAATMDPNPNEGRATGGV